MASLNLVTKSNCLSHLEYDPAVDIPAAELAAVLTCTDRLLTTLIQHLRELVGENDIGRGPLEHWIGYQVDTKDLPAPQDLFDDENTIKGWLTKVRNKVPTVPGQPPPSPLMPRQSTVSRTPDSSPLTLADHPDAFLSNGPFLPQISKLLSLFPSPAWPWVSRLSSESLATTNPQDNWCHPKEWTKSRN